MTVTTDRSGQKGPQQKRSRARRAALVERGITLLNEHDLDELSIADITDALGYSTGSFYSYFPDKSAFFVDVQKALNAEQAPRIAALFAPSAMTPKSPAQRLTACVDFALDYFRTHTGVIRSALRYERRIPEAWAPNRATTQRLVDAACRGLDPADQERLAIAVQLAFGMLVNALLHDPGPLRLHDKAMGPKIIAALTPYLSSDRPEHSP